MAAPPLHYTNTGWLLIISSTDLEKSVVSQLVEAYVRDEINNANNAWLAGSW
jgi:hypothetical protein